MRNLFRIVPVAAVIESLSITGRWGQLPLEFAACSTGGRLREWEFGRG